MDDAEYERHFAEYGRYFAARRRAAILDTLGVELVVDVGANEGQFGRLLRRHVTSFEPLGDAYERLAEARDTSWNAYRVALGATPGKAMLNRSQHPSSSSLLPMADAHLEAAPDSYYFGTEEVDVRTLDSFGIDGSVYLKIDAQGFESAILAGAEETIERAVVALELELSTTTLYEGQTLMGDMLNE